MATGARKRAPAERNLMQERQDRTRCDIGVCGVSDWKICLADPMQLGDAWTGLCGGSNVRRIDYVRAMSRFKNESFEHGIVCELLNLGYGLEALEVEFEGERWAPWGRGVWYKEHAEYAKPLPADRKDLNPALWHAMFRTQRAGDQRFSLYSAESSRGNGEIHLPRALVFRRVLFSLPAEAVVFVPLPGERPRAFAASAG